MNSPSPDQAFWRDPALPFVESRRACQSRACYRPHQHPTFSIGAVDDGRSVFTGAAGSPVTLHPGTLVFVPANRVHACNPAAGSAWSYQMLHLDAHWLRAVRHEYDPHRVAEDEPVRIVTDPSVYARFCRLNALLFSAADRHDKETALIEFMGDSDTGHDTHIDAPPADPVLSEQIQPALDVLRADCSANIALEALARLAGMSRYRLIRTFRSVTGMTPHAWQLNQRINLARERMHDGESMAALAQRLGFADQAHFQRVFKAHTGVTPGRFRKPAEAASTRQADGTR